MAVGEYTTLALVKADMDITVSTFDTAIQTKVDAANARISEYIGQWIGPSVDTVRLFDTPRGSRTSIDYRRLFIPGGIRALTLLESGTFTGDVFVTIDPSLYFLRPDAWTLPPGMAFSEIWISDALSVNANYAGFNTVRVTGTFGPAAVPASLVEIATTLAKRMYLSRQSGAGDIIGTSAFGTAIFSRFLSADDKAVLDQWRGTVTPFAGF